MKLVALIKATDKLRKLNARFVKVVAFKKGYNKKGQATAIAKTWTPLEYTVGNTIRKARDLNKYVSSITFIDKHLNVKCSCSCPDFMFRHEFALHQHGAADIIYGNGDPASFTNADNNPSICKHLVALRLIIKSQENV